MSASGAPLEQTRPFRPFVLWRRGTLAVGLLDGLLPYRTVALLDELDRSDAALARLTEQVSDLLSVAVPTVPVEQRKRLLALRRDIYNDRQPASADLALAEEVLPVPAAEVTRRWMTSWITRDACRRHAREQLAAEMRSARRRLVGLLSDDLLDAVLLSGREVYRSITAYRGNVAREGARPKNAKGRTAERTTVSFAYRAAWKPVPFGSFTEVGAQPWESAASSVGRGARTRRVRLNRGMLTWMAGELYRIEGRDKLMWLRLNNTVAISDGEVGFIRCGGNARGKSAGGELYVSAKQSPTLSVIVDLLADGPMPRGHAVEELTATLGVVRPAVQVLLDRLIDAGLCFQDLNLPDQTPHFSAAVAAELRRVSTVQATACAEVFEALQGIEDEFPLASPDRRADLLDRLYLEKLKFAGASGAPRELAELSVARSLIFEDVGRTGQSPAWSPKAVLSSSPAFEMLARILPIFDDSTLVRFGLHRHYTQWLTRAGRRGDPVDYFRAVASLPVQALSQIMTGADDPRTRDVLARRQVFLDHLAELSAGAGEIAEIDMNWLRRFIESLPEYLPGWESYACRLQIADVEPQPVAVLNEAMTGHGVYFSRFCDLLPMDEGWSLFEAVREEVARSHPTQTDLTAVLGLNISLHPRLAPLELLYPGSIAESQDPPPLTLRELAIDAGAQTGELRLVRARDGLPLTFMPMSFLFPAAAPSLYRFLCCFAPIRAVRADWWRRVAATGRGGARFPRLTLGGVVLDRSCLILPASSLPHAADAEELGSFTALRRWQRDNSLRDRCFFRVASAGRSFSAGDDWVEQTRRWAQHARRARDSKGHYLDFRQPLLLDVLLRRVADNPDGMLIVQECLPDCSGGADSGGAEEFLIEWCRSVARPLAGPERRSHDWQ